MGHESKPTAHLACVWCSRLAVDGARLQALPDWTAECRLGHGCARRPESHERVVEGRREYLLDGYWYSARALAAIAGVDHATVSYRLHRGWPVKTAVETPLDKTGTLVRLTARPLARVRVFDNGDLSPADFAALAQSLGITADALRQRCKKATLIDAIARARVAPLTVGRPPVRGRSTAAIAAELGVTRQALHKAARKAGRTLDEEIEHRRAQRAGKAAAA